VATVAVGFTVNVTVTTRTLPPVTSADATPEFNPLVDIDIVPVPGMTTAEMKLGEVAVLLYVSTLVS
jgi:hypothetical protein